MIQHYFEEEEQHFMNSRRELQMFLVPVFRWMKDLFASSGSDPKGLSVRTVAYSATTGCKDGSKLQPIKNVDFKLSFVNANVIYQFEFAHKLKDMKMNVRYSLVCRLIDSSCRMFDLFKLNLQKSKSS